MSEHNGPPPLIINDPWRPGPQRPAPRPKRGNKATASIVGVIIGLLVVVGMFAVMSVITTPKKVSLQPIPHTPPTVEMSQAVHDQPQRTPMLTSPGSGNGTWLVPSQIRPGTYRADPTDNIGGYVATCADLACDIDMDGDDSTGLIDNWTINGPTYVTIPSYAVAVQTDSVKLTLVSGSTDQLN